MSKKVEATQKNPKFNGKKDSKMPSKILGISAFAVAIGVPLYFLTVVAKQASLTLSDASSYVLAKNDKGWTLCPDGMNKWGSVKEAGSWDDLSNYTQAEGLSGGCYVAPKGAVEYNLTKNDKGWTLCPDAPTRLGKVVPAGTWNDLSNYTQAGGLTGGCYVEMRQTGNIPASTSESIDSKSLNFQSSPIQEDSYQKVGDESTPATLAIDSEMSSPPDQSTLDGKSQKFEWSDGGEANRYYDLHVGFSEGGRQYFDLKGGGVYASENVTVRGLPSDGSKVHVRLLWSDDNWETKSFRDFEYTASGDAERTDNIVVAESDILSNSFTDQAVGTYSDERFKADADWGRVRWAGFSNRAEVVGTDNKKLRVKFPAGVYGHRNSGGSAGVSFTPQDEIYQRMTVLFENGYDFKISGKIGGVGGPGGKYSGGNVPSNGEGYTSRFIWDSRGGNTLGNRAAIYLYHMDQSGRYGDQEGLGFTWETDVNYTLTQRIKRNTGSNKNGILQIWVSKDGGPHELVMDRDDMRWGIDGNGKTDTLLVNPFHGGSGQQYAPDNDSYMRLDDFGVSTKKYSDLP